MKLLLDNCVHYDAKRLFPGHEVTHASDIGWRELENGQLLSVAAVARFDALVTTDKNIRHQHDLASLPLAVLELNSLFTRIADLVEIAPLFDAALSETAAYLFVSVSPRGIEQLAPRRAEGGQEADESK